MELVIPIWHEPELTSNVIAKFKVNGFLYGKKVWIFTDSIRVAKKIQLDAECNGICSVIYEWTDEGWI